MKDDIDISIIIPVYNVEKYIDKFMTCLKKQTIQNFVAVFVDDNSSDNSIEIVEKYQNDFIGRMVVLKNASNLGPSGARNVGINYVYEHRTEYITFLDSDDWMDDEYLEDLYTGIKNADICMSGLIRYNENLSKDVCIEMISMKYQGTVKIEDCDELAYINTCLYSKLFRFDPIRAIRFRNMKRSEDTCYLFEALNCYKTLIFTNNAFYHYCVRNESLTGTMNMEKYYAMHREFSSLLSEFEKCNCRVLDQFISQIFIRSSIGGVYRLSGEDVKNALRMEKTEYAFLEKEISGWRHCKYLTFSHGIIGGKKGGALAVCAYLYKMHIFFLFVLFYCFVSQKLQIEVRM